MGNTQHFHYNKWEESNLFDCFHPNKISEAQFVSENRQCKPEEVHISSQVVGITFINLCVAVTQHWVSFLYVSINVGFPGGSDGKESACNAGDLSSIPGLGRSPGEGNGNPLQYSCLENPMDRGAWKATVHAVTNSQTQLEWPTLLHFHMYLLIMIMMMTLIVTVLVTYFINRSSIMQVGS